MPCTIAVLFACVFFTVDASVAFARQGATPQELFLEVSSGVLYVESSCSSGDYIGTGFLVGPQTFITARHVVVDESGGTACTVSVVQEGTGARVAAGQYSIWQFDKDDAETTDLVTVHLASPLRGHYFKLAAHPAGSSTRIVALGYSLGNALSLNQGTVVRSFSQGQVPLLQLNLLGNHGSSGGPIVDLDGRVVGLTQRGNADVGEVFSLDLGAISPGGLCDSMARLDRTTLCTGSAVPHTVKVPPPNSPALSVYAGRRFSMPYPFGWSVDAAEKLIHGRINYIDTTIRAPANHDYLIRVDVTPGAASNDPSRAISPVLNALRKQNGYREIILKPITFQGVSAVYWEFQVIESGVLLRKVDIVFTSRRGDDVAILVQAPASAWNSSIKGYAWLTSNFSLK